MAYLFPRLLAADQPVAAGRKHSTPLSFTVVKTVDQYEQLIVDPRVCPPVRHRTWQVSPLALVSLVSFLVLVLCLLGLALYAGIIK
jgi:hypothetical protein